MGSAFVPEAVSDRLLATGNREMTFYAAVFKEIAFIPVGYIAKREGIMFYMDFW